MQNERNEQENEKQCQVKANMVQIDEGDRPERLRTIAQACPPARSSRPHGRRNRSQPAGRASCCVQPWPQTDWPTRGHRCRPCWASWQGQAPCNCRGWLGARTPSGRWMGRLHPRRHRGSPPRTASRRASSRCTTGFSLPVTCKQSALTCRSRS